MSDRNYKFTWDFIGNVPLGRPNLGNLVPVEVYRMFQYTLRDALEQELGTEKADLLMKQGGYIAGRSLCEKYVGRHTDLNAFFDKVQSVMAELKIGVVFVEESSPEDRKFVITVAEDLDCSGLPEVGHAVCSYDEGFIAGIFSYFDGREYDVKEIDCWCTGGRSCRFEIRG